MDRHWRFRTSTLKTLQSVPFLWGTAVSGHQVDGNNVRSDWWTWEQHPGHITDGTSSGPAINFWHHWHEDLDLAASLGTNAFRFSLEWARIVPTRGSIDSSVLAHYETLIRGCQERGLEPIVTVWHFSLPQWFAERGGWRSATALEDWTSYLQGVIPLLKRTGVRFVCTLNEPEIYVHQSYRQGTWPPGERSVLHAWSVYKTLATVHRRAYRLLHADIDWQPVVLLVVNHAWLETAHQNGLSAWMERRARSVMQWISAQQFLRWVHRDFDCLGLNYYFRNRIQWEGFRAGWKIRNPNRWTSDLGWDIDPDGLRHLLISLQSVHRPIMITENGLADARDRSRTLFLTEHISSLRDALNHESPVIGYLHWSLLDNVEWSHGKSPRFGLIAVDYESQERYPRPSANAYRALISSNQQDFQHARDRAILTL